MSTPGPDERVVYAVLAHRLPDQIARLTSLLLDRPESAVLVHYDGHDAQLDSRVHAIRHRPVAWGLMSIPQLFLDALEQAVAVPGAEWVVILSGQDYPLRPLAQVHAELMASPYDIHLDTRAVRQGDPWPLWEPLTRYGYGFTLTPEIRRARLRRPLWNRIYRDCRVVQERSEGSGTPQPWEVLPRMVLRNVGNRLAVGRRRRDNPFRHGRELYAGDAWFMVRREAAVRILEVVRREQHYVRYMSRTLVPDEAFFHTLVANWLPDLQVGPYRRHRVFRPGESHPHVWQLPELPELLATGADFARKFDSEVDAEILDELDSRQR